MSLRTESPLLSDTAEVVLLRERVSKLEHELDRERVERERLARRERELTQFIENASIGLHWVGPDGIIQWANKADYEPLGYTAQEYLGQDIRKFHAEAPVIQDILERLTRGERLREYEARLRCKDGSARTVLIDSCVLWDGDQFVHTQCFTRDVTEQRKVEALQRQLAAIVENCEDAIYSYDFDERILSWNGGAEKLYGWTAAEIIGQPVTLLIPPERKKESRDKIISAIARGETLKGFETIRARRDGSVFHALLTASPLRDAGGKPIGLSIIVRDISERKKAERLEKGQKRVLEMIAQDEPLAVTFEALIRMIEEQSSSGMVASILLFDELEGRLRHGAAPNLPAAYNQLIDGIEIGPCVGSCGTAAFTKQPVYVADILTSPLWADFKDLAAKHGLRACWSTPIFSSSGSILGTFAMYYREPREPNAEDLRLVDVATRTVAIAIERQRAKEAQKRAEEKLERTVAERTAKLRETVEDLEAFSYSVSHDLRSPLRAMQGYAEELLASACGALNEEQQHFLTRIHKGAARLDRLTQEVLAYSRLARGEMRIEAIALGKLVDEILEQYPNLRAAKQFVRVERPLLDVLGNEACLTQAISNLLANSVKFVAPGQTPDITVRTEQRGSTVRFWVEDRGIGIDAKYQKRIFQLFGRIHPESKYDGTGVGLAIVKKGIERLNGKIGFESVFGEGSSFWFELPAVPSHWQNPPAEIALPNRSSFVIFDDTVKS